MFVAVSLTLLRVRVCLMVGFCIAGVSVASGATRLELQSKSLTDGKIDFKSGPCYAAPAPSGDSRQMPQAETANYIVLAIPGRTLPGNFGYFVYEFYVEPKSSQQPGVQGCGLRVQGLPSGTFVDKMADVAFQVGDDARVEDGTIRIPLYNNVYAKPILESQAPSLPEVSLSGESLIEIGISNTLPDLQVGLYKDIGVDSQRPSMWQVHPQAALQLPRSGPALLQPGQKLATGILLVLKPNPWRALGASMFPLAPEKPHETLVLHLNYDTPGGIPGTLDIPVAMRFRPSFWSLLLAVVLGSALGAAFAQLASTQAAKWYKAFSIAVIAALLAEVIGMLLVYARSEFRLFGIELDPYQLLPAIVIGALVGIYGFRKTDDFLALLKKKDGS
jgi:hypothetical protein